MDNCGPQNKNWSLYTALVAFVNSKQWSFQSITLKYFEAGHTFMSADSFHHQVEKSVAQKKHLYNFGEFAECVGKAGKVILMKSECFQQWENKLSQGKISKETRPLLDDVVIAKFSRNECCFRFKRSYSEESGKKQTFCKKCF